MNKHKNCHDELILLKLLVLFLLSLNAWIGGSLLEGFYSTSELFEGDVG